MIGEVYAVSALECLPAPLVKLLVVSVEAATQVDHVLIPWLHACP